MVSRDQQILRLLAMHRNGCSATELRSALRPKISQPTLWRRLDRLRTAGQLRSIGRGRSTRYVRAESGHSLVDLRSGALHREVGRKLARHPELVEAVRMRLHDMKRSSPYASAYLDRWEQLLSGPIESLLQVLGANDEDSIALRHVSPFAGLLTAHERLAVLKREGLRR